MRVSELVPRVKNKRFFLPFLTLGTSTKLLGFMRVLAILDPLEISSGGQLFRPPTYPKGGKVSENLSARTRVSVLHRRERQLAAPGRELTAEALRRCVAARANSRDARTGARAVIETSPRVRGVRGRTGQAAFLRSAKAGRSQKIYSARTRASESIKRGASRRSEARIVQSGHGPRNDSPGTGQLSYGLRWESGQVREKPRKHAVSRICPHGQEPKLFQVAFDHRGKCRNPHKT